MAQYYDILLPCPQCGCSVINEHGICMGYITKNEKIYPCNYDRKNELYIINRRRL